MFPRVGRPPYPLVWSPVTHSTDPPPVVSEPVAGPTVEPEPIVLRTKPNRHFPFLSRHPWVLATALQDRAHVPRDGLEKPAEAEMFGQTAELLDHDGNWIARGLYNPASRLRLRLYSFEADQKIDDELFARRIDEAVARRRLAPGDSVLGGSARRDSTVSGPPPAEQDSLSEGGERLIFSESDRLSGLIVDRYADCLSIQFTSAALLSRGQFLIDQLLVAAEKYGTPCTRVVVRMDATTAKHEGVSPDWIAKIESWSRGVPTPDVPSEDPASEDSASEDPAAGDSGDTSLVWYRHHRLKMAIDLREGQKTGGYLDQQNNHSIAASYMKDRRVLDICTYTGGFALSAALAGASEVIGVDSSERALELARRNAQANSLTQVRFEKADCFDDLKERGQRGEKFDAIILDPPRFAGSRRQVDAALRAYARLNMSAVDLLPPGGILVTCSCSGHVSRADFLNMLVDVGRKRRRDLILLRSLGPSPDHPCAVSCPESDYLKCVIAQVQ